MFLKQYNYKPRSNSTSSQSSQSGADAKKSTSVAGSPPKDTKIATENTGPLSSAIAGRRRSSGGETQFAGLQGLKRNSQDERKASFAEQKPGQSGILGGMWNSFTKGTSS